MSSIKLRNGKILENFGRPYFVAEVNTSHYGNIDIARQMIDAAVDAGCDCVKFQSWTSASLYSKCVYQDNPMAKRMADLLSMSEDQLATARSYCSKQDIDFSSTPYSEAEADFLVDPCGAPFIKVASMDLNNYPFLSYIARKDVPIVLSTGMSDIEEIKRAVCTIEKEGNHSICLLHCVSLYPPKYETINLNNILGLREIFPMYPIGLSDHSPGHEIAAAAVAMGAALIEKHLTLDKSRAGWDNDMAMEPDEMKSAVKACHNVWLALGQTARHVGEEEIVQRSRIRRSVVSRRAMKKGSVLTLKDMALKRPGTGVPPERMSALTGRTINKDIEADELILDEHLENERRYHG